MRSKSLLLLAVALACGTVAAFAATQVIKDQGNKTAIETIEILVATKDCAVNTKISAERFQLEKWPRDRLPAGAIRDFKAVEGKFTSQRLYQGEPLLERKVNATNESIAQTIPPGFSVFDLPVDSTNGGVGYIQPGHRVDIHGFFEKGGRLRESKSIMVMENVEVLMVDGVAVRDQDENANRKAGTIQLLIRASQFEALNTAKYLGKLNVSLRPAAEKIEGEAGEVTDNGDAFLDWVKVAVAEEGGSPAKSLAAETKISAKSMPSQPKNRMLVFSPTGTESYVWNDENELPQKVDPNATTARENASYSYESSSESSNTQGLTSGMVWDGKQWTYNPSGFKPAYPSADDDKTKKQGFSDQSDQSNAPSTAQ
jgi:Flp pilus assembly protein CpaB